MTNYFFCFSVTRSTTLHMDVKIIAPTEQAARDKLNKVLLLGFTAALVRVEEQLKSK